MIDPWANWRRRLAGDKTVMTYENEPDQGFYRLPIKEKTAGGATRTIGWKPVSIFYHEGELYCVISGAYVTRDRAIEAWLWCSKHAVEEEQYRAVADRGELWFDAPHTGVAPPAASPPSARGSVMGDNQPAAEPEMDPLAELRETIASAIGAVKGLKVTTDEEAARAQASRSRLLELSTKADKMREEEKAPHLKAGREVDDKYRSLVQDPKETADAIRVELKRHENEKLRKQQEAEAAAAKAAEEHAKAVKKAQRKGEEPPLPPPPPPTPERTSTIKGGYGRAASVQVVQKGKIVDLGKVLTHYIAARNEAILLAIANEVQKDVRAGITIPGVEVIKEADVR